MGDIWTKFNRTKLVRISKKVLKSEGFNPLVQYCMDFGITVSLQIDWLSNKRGLCAKCMCSGGRAPIVTCKYCGCLLHLTLAVDTFVGCGIKAYRWISTNQPACNRAFALALKKLIVPWIHSRKIRQTCINTADYCPGPGFQPERVEIEWTHRLMLGQVCTMILPADVELEVQWLCSWQEWSRAAARTSSGN